MTSSNNFGIVKLELQKYGIDVMSSAETYEALLNKLTLYINHLIVNDFSWLISLLYRLDISENKLRYFLDKNKGEQAAMLIAQLIIERQLQKIEARKNFRKDDSIPEDEKW